MTTKVYDRVKGKWVVVNDVTTELTDISPINSQNILGRVSADNGPVESLTNTDVKSILGLVISDVSGLQTALNAKQATLVNQTNIKSINGQSLLGSGDLTVASSRDLGSIVLYLESIGLINLVVNSNGDYMTDTNGNYIHTTFTKNIVTTG